MLDIPGLEYFKAKNSWCGSFNNKRCRLCGTQELEACIWPEPYEFNKTAQELKAFKSFAFSQQGLEQAKAFLEEGMALR